MTPQAFMHLPELEGRITPPEASGLRLTDEVLAADVLVRGDRRPSRWIVPVASFGAGEEYLRDVKISADAGSLYGQGAAGTAVRERRLAVVQDYLADARTASLKSKSVLPFSK